MLESPALWDAAIAEPHTGWHGPSSDCEGRWRIIHARCNTASKDTTV